MLRGQAEKKSGVKLHSPVLPFVPSTTTDNKHQDIYFFVSFVGPHDPFDPPSFYADKYRRNQMPKPIAGPADDKPERYRRFERKYTADQVIDMRRQYCAVITAIDDGIGRILRALEESGQAENTFIFFTSDHGEMIGDHGLHAKNVPYGSAWRIPLLISGPGIAPGDTGAMVELMDINPTICELTGTPPSLSS